MKKQFVCLTSILFSIASFCQEQETEFHKVRIGIKQGIAMANTRLETIQNPEDHSMKIGGMGGVFLRMSLSSNLHFQPEILMVGKGAKNTNQYYEYGTDLTYLEFPLNLLYKTSTSKTAFFIGGGPAPAFFLGENVFYMGNLNSKSFDLGINLLTGIEMPIGFSVSFNYTHGILNVSPNKEYIPMLKNRSFGLTVGYLFR